MHYTIVQEKQISITNAYIRQLARISPVLFYINTVLWVFYKLTDNWQPKD